MNKMKKAEEYFQQQRFRASIPLYREVLQEVDYRPAKERLAEAYRRIGDFEAAARWYGLVIGEAESTPEQKYQYALTLLWANRCEEAQSWFQEYLKFKPYDERKPLLQDVCKYYDELLTKNRSRVVITHLNINSPVNDYAPAVYREGIVFTSTLDSRLSNLYYSKKSETDSIQQFADPTSFSGKLNTVDFHEGIASFNKEQDQIFFTRTRTVPDKYKINGKNPLEITSARLLPKGNWSELEALPISSDKYSVAHPSVSVDGKQLYFSSNMPGGYGGKDIYLSVYKDSIWGPPINLGPTINTAGDEVFPAYTQNGELYFSSDGHLGMGGQDIYRTKENSEGLWERPQNMGAPLNSPSDDFAITFQADGQGGFFTSNREGGLGGDDLYHFEWRGTLVVLDVVSLSTGFPIADTRISISASEDTIRANEQGRIQMYIHECLEMQAQADGYLSRTIHTCEEGKSKLPDTLFLVLSLKEEAELLPEPIEVLPPPPPPFVTAAAQEPSLKALEKELSGFEKSKRSSDEEDIYLLNVYYDVGRSSVRGESVGELKRLLAALQENTSVIVEIQSHTDANGQADSNLRLSQRRADAIVRYLVKSGIDRERLIAKGYGESKLVNECSDGVPCSEEAHQENRRTEFRVIGLLK
jgi:outer membrane protein OmpA-like peptidoglycan-associated protein